MSKMPNEKWLNKTVTISREEFSDIIAKETGRVLRIAGLFGEEFTDTLKDLLFMFSACVGTEMFGSEDTDTVEVEE